MACSKPTTRSNTEIYLIGFTNDVIHGSRLPSRKQTLQFFFYQLKANQKTVRESAHITIEHVAQFWNKAHLPMTTMQHAIGRLEKMYAEWRNLQKASKRGGPTQIAKEETFLESLEKTFNIAHADAEVLIQNPEDKAFLQAQLGDGRKTSSMAQVDTKLTAQIQREKERHNAVKARAEREAEETRKRFKTAAESTAEILESDSSANISDINNSENSEYDDDEAVTPKAKRPRPKNIVTPEVAAALDRTKISDRNAVYALSSFSLAVGQDPDGLALNRWSIRRSRMKHRDETIAKLKDSFAPKVPLVVHWDGKLLPDISERHEKVDRLPILVSGQGVERLLNVAKLPNGTGEAMANAVVEALDDWHIASSVKAMSFDTTASNSGIRAGAAVLIEEKLGRELLHLACRHHVFEVVLGDVFNSLAGPSSGPDILMFKRFQSAWPSIVRDRIVDGMSDDETATVFRNNISMMNEALEFATACLQGLSQPRDDYRELLELSLIYMGHIPPRGVHLEAPGAMHRARWMAKAIYSLKIFLFRSQFSMTIRETNMIRSMNLFICLVYLKSWFTAPMSIQAPLNDLSCFERLVKYKAINPNVAKVAIKALSRHTWYLSEELIAFSFFDARIEATVKAEMLQAMRTKDGAGIPPKRPQVSENSISSLKLVDFVTANTMRFFSILGIPSGWLDNEPDSWYQDSEFVVAQQAVAGLSVVNDRAERGVALIQEYNEILTKNEGQKQALLQVVSEHRKKFPDPKKSTVTKESL